MGQAEHTQFTMATAGLTRERETEREREGAERRVEERRGGVEEAKFISLTELPAKPGWFQPRTEYPSVCM